LPRRKQITATAEDNIYADEIILPATLVTSILVGIDVVFGRGGDLFRLGKSRAQCAQDDKTRYAQTARCGKLIREEKKCSRARRRR